jgi:hypothetical protein
MFVRVELFYETQGDRERNRESAILKYITSGQVEDITTCTESC